MQPHKKPTSRARATRLADPYEIPRGVLAAGEVFARFAEDEEDLEHLDRHGLIASAWADRADVLHHVAVYDERSRIPLACATLTSPTGRRHLGLRAEESFHLGEARDGLERGVEVRSVTFADAGRCGRVEALLARSLARYLVWNERSVVFGTFVLPAPDAGYAEGVAAALHARHAFDACVTPVSARSASATSAGSERHVALPHTLENLIALGAFAHPSVHYAEDAAEAHVLLELDLTTVDAHVKRTLVERGGPYAWREWTVFAA